MRICFVLARFYAVLCQLNQKNGKKVNYQTDFCSTCQINGFWMFARTTAKRTDKEHFIFLSLRFSLTHIVCAYLPFVGLYLSKKLLLFILRVNSLAVLSATFLKFIYIPKALLLPKEHKKK